MTLNAAKELRDYIKSCSYHCTVPLGWGPDGYWAQIYGTGTTRFQDRAEFRKHHAMRLRQRRKAARDYEAMLLSVERRSVSPLDRMIDQACGL